MPRIPPSPQNGREKGKTVGQPPEKRDESKSNYCKKKTFFNGRKEERQKRRLTGPKYGEGRIQVSMISLVICQNIQCFKPNNCHIGIFCNFRIVFFHKENSPEKKGQVMIIHGRVIQCPKKGDNWSAKTTVLSETFEIFVVGRLFLQRIQCFFQIWKISILRGPYRSSKFSKIAKKQGILFFLFFQSNFFWLV